MSTGRNGIIRALAANQRDEVRDMHDVAAALGAQPGIKQQTFVAGFSAGAGAKAGGIGYSEKISPTRSVRVVSTMVTSGSWPEYRSVSRARV